LCPIDRKLATLANDIGFIRAVWCVDASSIISSAFQRPRRRIRRKNCARRRPKGGRLPLREVAKALATEGYLNERGKPFAAKSVASMLA
jgi:hypothetical protein